MPGIQPGEQVQHGGIAGDHGGAQIGKGFPTGGKRVRRLLPDLLYNGGLKRFQPVFVAVIDAGNHIAAKAALGVHPALDAQQFAIRQIIEISDHSGGANIYSKAAPRFDWRIDGKLRKNGGGLDLAAGIAGIHRQFTGSFNRCKAGKTDAGGNLPLRQKCPLLRRHRAERPRRFDLALAAGVVTCAGHGQRNLVLTDQFGKKDAGFCGCFLLFSIYTKDDRMNHNKDPFIFWKCLPDVLKQFFRFILVMVPINTQ